MITGVFYLNVCVFSLCAIWLVWEFGFKALLLDAFRQRLFELRIALFSMAESGRISHDHEAYRAIEAILNGCIRYAHRLTFLSYLCSAWENSRARRQDTDYVDFSQQLALKISRLNPSAQAEITEILGKLRAALSLYMAATSAIFKVFFAVYLVAKLVRATNVENKMASQVIVIEREVYLSVRGRYNYSTGILAGARS